MVKSKYTCPKSLRQITRVWLVIFLLLVGGCGSQEPTATSKKLPPPTVVVETLTPKTVPIYQEYVARTEARQTVEIRARVEGFLEKVFFKEGSVVKAGQPLFLIDQRPYKAALQDANGSLAQARAAMEKAQKDVDRLRPLVAADAAPQQDLDKAVAESLYSRAAIEKGKAAVVKADLDLKFTKIHSPITGIIGKEEVTVGNLVVKDKTLLTTISSWDPMRVVFSISESDYLLLAKRYLQGKKTAPAPDQEPFALIMADNSLYPYKGKVSFVDRALDLTTGTLKIYVSFPNPDQLLRPGLFGRIRVELEEKPNALLVPQRAVQELQGLKTVLVVGQDNKVAVRTITLGDRYQDFFIVTHGLKPGERVVVEGLQKAIPGQKVTPAEQPLSQEKKGS